MSKDNPEAFETFEFDLPPIRGFPELRWAGKRPFKSTQYFPAQKRESYGDPTDGWWNRIYWGDNLQVMSHLLREFRGKVDLIYIDPPFDSGADYKKKIAINGASAAGDASSFEEKQYSDIWSGDEFCQFLYERIVLSRELLSKTGTFIIHCDQHKNHHIRSICDEIFGVGLSPDQRGFRGEVAWCYGGGGAPKTSYPAKHDTILWYSMSDQWTFNKQFRPYSEGTLARGLTQVKGDQYELSDEGAMLNSWWAEPEVQKILSPTAYENLKYPTQKPEGLLKRIITGHSNPGDLVLDAFMGSGTTQAVAVKLGRRFIGIDINLGAIETAVKRLNRLRAEPVRDLANMASDDASESSKKMYTGFEVYNVNNYDLFRNPAEARELIQEAMELQPLPPSSVFDGQRDGYLVKIMPVNRIATRADLNEVINGLDFKAFERRQADTPSKKVERIHLVCMGHEPDLGAELVKAAKPFDIEVIVTDLIRDKAHLHFKKSSDARLAIGNGELAIVGFYPMNLLQKLSLEPGAVEKWQQLVESVKVDFNYDGAVLTPSIVDAPSKNELVAGRYPIPADAGTIRVKITDLLSESWEGEIENA